jgi:hypothetical protein
MRTELTLGLLKSRLQQNCGDILEACQSVGVSLIFVNQWRKDDKEVHDQLTESEQVGTQGLLSAALQRGVRGIEEDVYYKGEVVGQKKVYSDGLLQSLLKAKVPEFAKDGEGAGVSVHVNIANVMPRANNYQEWLEMKQNTLAPPMVQIPDLVEAEFTEVDVLRDLL